MPPKYNSHTPYKIVAEYFKHVLHKNYLGDLYHHPNTCDNFSFNTLGYKV